MASQLGKLRGGKVTARTSDTVFRMGDLEQLTDDIYNGALLREQGDDDIVLVTDYDASDREFTVGSGLSIAVGDYLEFCWWDPDERALAVNAMQEAIRFSWDWWHREVVVEASASSITLAAGDDDYDLPAACDALIEIGVGADPIHWIPPVERDGRVNYRVEGQPGALVLRMEARFSREGTIADVWTTQKLALHYRSREPEITETGDTQLPLGYFAVASWFYARNLLGTQDERGLQRSSFQLPQLQQAAQMELNKLGIGKMLPSLLVAAEQVQEQAKDE